MAIPETPSTDEAPRLTSTPARAAFWALTKPGTDRPEEIPAPATVGSERFPRYLERFDPSKRNHDGLTRLGQAFFEVLKTVKPQAANEALIQESLALEQLTADSSQAMAALKNLHAIPTDMGDLLVVDLVANTVALLPDPENPRFANQLGVEVGGGGGYRFTKPVFDVSDAPSGHRKVTFENAAHLQSLVDAHREALGFQGPVRDRKNRLDIERFATGGIHEPAIATISIFEDAATGATGMVPTVIDASRRVTGCHRLLRECLPGLPIEGFAYRHFETGVGLDFTTLTADDVDANRKLLADAYADIDGPAPTGDHDGDADAVARWAAGIDATNQVAATAIRVRAMPCRVVLGVDPATVPADVEHPLTTALETHRASRHLPDFSELPWDSKAAQQTVARDILRRAHTDNPLEEFDDSWARTILFDPTATRWARGGIASTVTVDVATRVPGTAVDGLDVVDGMVPLTALPELVSALPSVIETDPARSRLDLALVASAAFVCRSRPFTKTVNASIRRAGMPTSPKQKGQLVASVLLPLFALPVDGSEAARVHAALSRTVNHGAVYKLDEHVDPLEGGVAWPDLIGTDWFDIVGRARNEANTIASSRRWRSGFGPAQTILSLAAAIALEVSPAVRSGSAASQLTVSGMGGRRGDSTNTAEPLAILLPLTETAEGIAQLFEAVVALINDDGPYIPRSVRYDRDLASDHSFGVTLTEYDLRGPTWGHGSGSGQPTRFGAGSYVLDLFERMRAQLATFASTLDGITNPDNADVPDPELDADADDWGASPAAAFFGDGIDVEVADAIVAAATTISNAATAGRTIRTVRFGGR